MFSFISICMLFGALNAASAPKPTVTPPQIIFFVSQATFLGDGTQAAFDAACWDEGSSQNPGEPFGAAVANIFGTTPKPYDRVSGLTGVVVNTNGDTIAPSIDDLWPQDASFDVNTYELDAFILDIDGNVNNGAASHVWTGSASLTSGASGADCAGWTSTSGLAVAGNAAVTDANWWNEFFDFCSGVDGQSAIRPNSVYCYQLFQGAAIVKDPVFSGFDGSDFEFQGLPNQMFSLISSPHFNMNAKFVPYGHGSFVGAVGLEFNGNKLFVDANNTVILNGQSLSKSSIHEDFQVNVDKKKVSLSIGAYHVDVKFITNYRLDLGYSLNMDSFQTGSKVHGLIGQTINNIGQQPKIGEDNMGKGVIEGAYVDYLVSDLFSNDCTFCVSQFHASAHKRSPRSVSQSGLFYATYKI